MFGRKQEEPRKCPEGHLLEESWEQCPFCAAAKAEPKATEIVTRSAATAPADPGDGAIVVSRKVSAPRRLAGWVVVTDGEDLDRDFRLHVGRNVLGKGADCDVVLKDPHASEHHAVIDCHDGQFEVMDLDSKYGTTLNGQAVNGGSPLKDSALLRLGHTELRFRSFEA